MWLIECLLFDSKKSPGFVQREWTKVLVLVITSPKCHERWDEADILKISQIVEAG